MKRTTPKELQRRKAAFKQWIEIIAFQHHVMYANWCNEHRVEPDWDKGYYQYLCRITDAEHD